MAPSLIHSIVPAPLTVEAGRGPGFTVSPSTVIYVQPGDERVAAVGRYLSDLIGIAAAPTPPSVRAADGGAGHGEVPAGSIHLATRAGGTEEGEDEGYELTVRTDGVTLTAANAAGLFYAVLVI